MSKFITFQQKMSKAIKKMDVYRIWEDEATNYTKQILDDINEWLEESTEKENILEEKRTK